MIDLCFVFGSQQTLECIAEEAKIQNCNPCDNFDQSSPLHASFKVIGEITNHVASHLKSTSVSAEVTTRYLLAIDKNKKGLKLIFLEGHQWHLRFSDHNFCGCVKGVLYVVLSKVWIHH